MISRQQRSLFLPVAILVVTASTPRGALPWSMVRGRRSLNKQTRTPLGDGGEEEKQNCTGAEQPKYSVSEETKARLRSMNPYTKENYYTSEHKPARAPPPCPPKQEQPAGAAAVVGTGQDKNSSAASDVGLKNVDQETAHRKKVESAPPPTLGRLPGEYQDNVGLYAELLRGGDESPKGETPTRFSEPSIGGHLRLGMTILGMLYTCEAIGFLALNHEPPRCSKNYPCDHNLPAAQKIPLDGDWGLTDWVHTYERQPGVWTHAVFGPDFRRDIFPARVRWRHFETGFCDFTS